MVAGVLLRFECAPTDTDTYLYTFGTLSKLNSQDGSFMFRSLIILGGTPQCRSFEGAV